MRIKLLCEFAGDDVFRGGGPHFSRNSSISGWFNRARQQSRWIFITNKWTSEIADNSALIHGQFHRNRVTRKDNNMTIENHSHAGRTWSCGQYFMDRRRDNHSVQSTIDAGCLGYGCMPVHGQRTIIAVIAPIARYAYCAIIFSLLRNLR